MMRYLIVSFFSGVFFLSAYAVWAQSQPAASSAATQNVASEGGKPKPEIPSTLMFSIDELNDIQSRAASVNSADSDGADKGDAIENATLYLSTIVYYGPQSWTIWVNGKPISPGEEFKSFQITDIGPRFVELLVPLSAQGMRPVRLEPNQTFVAKSGAVVEGPWKQ